MKEIMKDLRNLRGKVPKQTIKTIRGQAIAGDITAARKGLEKIKKQNKSGYVIYV